MVNQNPEFVKEILLKQVHSVQAEIVDAFSNTGNVNGLRERLQTGTRYNGNGKVEAYLAFSPDQGLASESLDLTLRINCTPRGAVFASEIGWSNGKIIDEVLVCNFCPDCLESLVEEVERVLDQKRSPLVGRMVELLGNFQPA